MDQDDSRVRLARRARAARARTVFIDFVGGAFLAAALVLWLAREGLAIAAPDFAQWATSLDQSERLGLPILGGVVLVAAQNARIGSAASGPTAGEQRAEAKTFGEISCLAASALHAVALFTVWVVLRAGADDSSAFVLAGCATVLGTVVSCLSSAVRRPTYCDDDVDREEAIVLADRARGWHDSAPAWWRWTRLPLIGVVPGAVSMLVASVVVLRLGVAGHVRDLAELSGCGVCLGVLSVGVHFNAFRTVVLAHLHGRSVLAGLVIMSLAAFEFFTTRSALTGSVTPWSVAMAAVLIGTAAAFTLDFVMVMRRSPWPGLGLASSVRAALLRDAGSLGGADAGGR